MRYSLLTHKRRTSEERDINWLCRRRRPGVARGRSLPKAGMAAVGGVVGVWHSADGVAGSGRRVDNGRVRFWGVEDVKGC